MNNQYGPPGFTPPPYGYGAPPPPPMGPMGPMGPGYPNAPRTHGLAIASMVCGILAVFPGCCCGLFGIPLSIAALIMGIVSISQINASAGQLGGKGMALAGTICGGVAVAMDIAAVFLNLTSQALNTMHV